MKRYTGPLRDEPIAVELHNTVYADGGAIVDALADPGQARAWGDAITARLALGALPPGPGPAVADLVALRGAVRGALRDTLAGDPPDRADLQAINAASARAPRSARADIAPAGAQRRWDFHGASRAAIVLSVLARDAIDLLTGPLRDELRSCGAPGCVLVFVRDHPRRTWCSNGCGNRARQARHYRRSRRA
jgi:predicted RNA-binding Zn ribbon-like protein